jgi:murein DD-endopeptidase MepM/ murein hydrolase activator NlpD
MSMSRKMKGGELTVFFILAGAAALVGLFMILGMIHVNSVLQVKKTITLSTDISDRGTAVLSLLNREFEGKNYMTVLGESVADNYASQPQDAYESLKQTLKTMEDHFSFEFQEKPLNLGLKYTAITTSEYGECGHTEPGLDITLAWPSETERITSGFGYRNAPRPCYCHSGLDIASGEGKSDEVRAAYDGVVVFVESGCKESPNCFLEPDNVNCGCGGGYGNRITLKHAPENGIEFYTHYCHLSEIYVENNQEVRAGQAIAKTGNTGRSEATHLHFELSTDKNLKDTDAINPCPYFDNSLSNCQQAETKSCGVMAGANIFNVEIPLPGAVTGNLKGKVVMEK